MFPAMSLSCSFNRVALRNWKKLVQDPSQQVGRTKWALSTTTTRTTPSPLSLSPSLSTMPTRNSEHHSNRCSNQNYWLPRRIILMRHGESVGNIDETAYSTIPDWKIPLTGLGKQQATQAGKEIKQLCGDNSLLYVYVSPYKRTMETWSQIKQVLEEENENDDGRSSSSPSVRIVGTRQEPRIAEQQFGNFQNPDKVQIAKEERINFGRFFFRFPNGEAGLDVYNRATSFLATMTRDLDQYRELMKRMVNKKKMKKLRMKSKKDSDTGMNIHHATNDVEHDHDIDNKCLSMENFNVLIITHGLCLRLIIMRYFQLTVEEFEESYNAENAKLYIMNRTIHIDEDDDGSDSAGDDVDSFYEEREFFRLDDESRDALNLKGDISNEKPVFRRDGYDL